MRAPATKARTRRPDAARPPRTVAEQPVREREERPEERLQAANTVQRAIGDMNDERRGMSRVVTRATPKKTSSTPNAHPQKHARRSEPRDEQSVQERCEPERAGDEGTDRPRREKRARRTGRGGDPSTDSTTVSSVLTGVDRDCEHPEHDTDSGDERATQGAADPVERLARKHCTFAHRCDGRHGRRAQAWIDAREQRHENADGQRDHDHMRLEHEPGVRKREAHDVEELEQALREE